MKTTKLFIFILAIASVAMVTKGGFKAPKMTNKSLDKNFKKWLNKDVRYHHGSELNTFFTIIDDDDKKTDYFTLYNASSLKSLKSFKIPLKTRSKGQKLFSTKYVILKDNIIQVYSYYDSKNDKFHVKGQKFDLKGKRQGKEVNMGTFSVKRKSEVGQVAFAISRDKSKIAIFRNPPDGRFEDEVLAISLFNNELEKLYDRNIKVSNASMLADVEALVVNDSGKLFLAVQEYKVKNPAKKRQKRELSNSEFKLYTIDTDSEVLDEIKIKSKDKFIFTINTVLSDDGNTLILSGLHNEVKNESKKEKRKSSYGFNGVYYISLNTKDWVIEAEKFSDISKENLEKIATAAITNEKKKAKAKRKLGDKDISLGAYKTRNIFVKKDKTMVMVMEKAYMVERCRTDPKTNVTTCVYYYYNMEILEFYLNTEGDLDRLVVIPKKQVTSGTSFYNGFITLINEDEELVHVYNDNALNFSEKKMAKHNDPFRYYFTANRTLLSKPKWMLAAVYAEASENSGKRSRSKQDKIVKKPYFDNRKNTTILMPRDGIMIDKHTSVCSFYQRKPKNFGISSFSYSPDK